MVFHVLQDLCDAFSIPDVPHVLSLAKHSLDDPGAHGEANWGMQHHDVHPLHMLRPSWKVAFTETEDVKNNLDDTEENDVTNAYKELSVHIKSPEQAKKLAQMILKEHGHEADEDVSDPVAYMMKRVDALEKRVNETKEYALREAENGIGSPDPAEQQLAEDPETREDLRGFLESKGGSETPSNETVPAHHPEHDSKEHAIADATPPKPSTAARPVESVHPATAKEAGATDTASAERGDKAQDVAADSKHQTETAETKHEESQPSRPPARRKYHKGDEVAECDSADGRWKVVVTPDGVRRLYDRDMPGVIQTRLQCDGEIPRGKGQDCGKVHWPCKNTHAPFRGHIQDIIDDIRPFCKVPGWHALIIGLGGGFIQTTLQQQCGHDALIDTAEMTPNVVQVAKNAFGFDVQSAQQHIEFGNGVKVAKDHVNAGDKYDFIFTDETSENGREFLETAQQLLKPTGRFAISKLGSRPTFSEDWLKTFHDFFSTTHVHDAKEGNHVIVATPLLERPKSKDVLATLGSHDSKHEAGEAEDANTKIKQDTPVSAQTDVEANATAEIKQASKVSPSPEPFSAAQAGAVGAKLSENQKPIMSGSTKEAKE